MLFYAHSLDGHPEDRWQPLPDHLKQVGDLAARFAQAFGAGELARAAGLLHDLGKYTEAFQSRVRGGSLRVDHATHGAKTALERFGHIGHVIAYAIAGHHAGLANGDGLDGQRTSLKLRVASPDLAPLLAQWQHDIDLATKLTFPAHLTPRSKENQVFMVAFLIRMVFSCLVDADFLDTEAFYAQAEGRAVQRRMGAPDELRCLQTALHAHLQAKQASAPDTHVNRVRTRILQHVRAQATLPPGLFSLNVPTGGGKTLASLAFALDHAVQHHLRRVLYVIPFTSIVEQTAQVFREALEPHGDGAVLEHHSAFEDDPQQAKEARDKLHLAMENWDCPVVVTTAVQFFESLFADRPSRCRKLHNVAGSVIVLDEAQTLPLQLLRPTLAALDELARHYRCSIVFCTATQPALDDERFACVIGRLRELAPTPADLARDLRRVSVAHVPHMSDEAVIDRMRERDQVLCIVNNRLHARALFQGLQGVPGARHLTTLMCAKHRRQVLDEVRADLKARRPCRLVSTSLIEAGVDLSFPQVLRAEAGLDSIAQAAGRCNREGAWFAQDSVVTVFGVDEAQWPPPPALAQFAAVAKGTLRRYPDDPLRPEAIRDYFGELYWAQGDEALDRHQLLKRLRESRLDSLPFETLAEKYRLIDTVQCPVIVPFDKQAQAVINNLAFAEGAVGLGRDLQPYTVQVPRHAYAQLMQAKAIAPVAPEKWGEQFVVLMNPDLYSQDFGLFWDDPSFIRETRLVC